MPAGLSSAATPAPTWSKSSKAPASGKELPAPPATPATLAREVEGGEVVGGSAVSMPGEREHELVGDDEVMHAVRQLMQEGIALVEVCLCLCLKFCRYICIYTHMYVYIYTHTHIYVLIIHFDGTAIACLLYQTNMSV